MSFATVAWVLIASELRVPSSSQGGRASKSARPGLVTFTLVRGGPSEGDYASFVNSRRCLLAAMPDVLPYDDVAFHEGNVPARIESTLRGTL